MGTRYKCRFGVIKLNFITHSKVKICSYLLARYRTKLISYNVNNYTIHQITQRENLGKVYFNEAIITPPCHTDTAAGRGRCAMVNNARSAGFCLNIELEKKVCAFFFMRLQRTRLRESLIHHSYLYFTF